MKLDYHIGVTFQIGSPGSNQYGRIDIRLYEIEVDGNLEAQMQKGVEAARVAFESLLRELDKQVDKYQRWKL